MNSKIKLHVPLPDKERYAIEVPGLGSGHAVSYVHEKTHRREWRVSIKMENGVGQYEGSRCTGFGGTVQEALLDAVRELRKDVADKTASLQKVEAALGTAGVACEELHNVTLDVEEPGADRASGLNAVYCEKMRFEGLYGAESVCFVRVFHKSERPVVVVTELPENKGTSITNWASRVFQQAAINARVHGLDPIFVEHYPPRGVRPQSFCVVRFNSRFDGPKWKHLTVAELDVMTGAPGAFDDEVVTAIGGGK